MPSPSKNNNNFGLNTNLFMHLLLLTQHLNANTQCVLLLISGTSKWAAYQNIMVKLAVQPVLLAVSIALIKKMDNIRRHKYIQFISCN